MLNVRLEKLSDDKFNGLHPNGIIEGSVRIGKLYYGVEEGASVVIGTPTSFGFFPKFYTSTVIKVIKRNKKSILFKTENSTYRLKILKNEN